MEAAVTDHGVSTELLEGLLDVVLAQAAAIECRDLAWFQELADRRASVQSEVEGLSLAGDDPATMDLLKRVAEVDAENIRRVTDMIEETSQQLDELHRGRIALNGYAYPGSDVARPGFVVDRIR